MPLRKSEWQPRHTDAAAEFSYGISMVLLILLLPTLESNYIFQLLMALIVSSAVRNLANF